MALTSSYSGSPSPTVSDRAPWAFHYGSTALGKISGIFWLLTGVFLLFRGFFLDFRVDSRSDIIWGALAAVALGAVKGQTVLRKMALNNLVRLSRLPQPSPVHHLFPVRTWILILFFMSLGMALRFSPVPPVIRSTVLLAVGLALLIGAFHYLHNLHLAQPQNNGSSPLST